MYIKIFPHGKGTGQAAVNYLTRMDYPGRTENPPVVLRGEPELTKALIASQDRQWKFCAGVLSWGPEDHVTPEQEQRLMGDFEQTAFAGLAPDQYAILWVRHSHAGHHELHFVIPRMELSTGKALNPFPPGWQKDFDPLRDMYNWCEGWTRPDDPARFRVRTPEHADIHVARLKRWGQTVTLDERTKSREQLTAFLLQRIEEGTVINRANLIEEIEGLGLKVPRKGKQYLTIEDEDGQRVRLKGGIYCEAWRAGQQNQLQTGAGQEAVGRSREARIATLSTELERVRERRAVYNGRRYPQPERDLCRIAERGDHTLGQAAQTLDKDLLPNALGAQPAGTVSVRGDDCGLVGTDVLHQSSSGEPLERNRRTEGTTNRINKHYQQITGQNVGNPSAGRQERTVHRSAEGQHNQEQLDLGKFPGPQTGVSHERSCETVAGMLGADGERNTLGAGGASGSHYRAGREIVRTRDNAPDRTNATRRLEQASHALEQRLREAGAAVAASERTLERLTRKSNQGWGR